MFDSENREWATLPGSQPMLMVLVDTEEEFDWSQPHNRAATGVTAMKAQARAHRVYEKFGVKPVYAPDFAVVGQPDGAAPLKELFADGLCDIGAHLHPWVNPPHKEAVNRRNSYPGNLPPALEEEKLRVLTDKIAEEFGSRPILYKAGRYGAGPATAEILHRSGYKIDASVLPWTDLRAEEGPDFSSCPSQPYWFGPDKDLLELPMTVGFSGLLRSQGKALHDGLVSPIGWKLHLPGLFARLRLFDRVTLTPEGITLDEMKKLTRAMLKDGMRYFSLTYHSPSLAPGNTPYVQSNRDLDHFLERIEAYLEFFTGEIGGCPVSAPGLYSEAKASKRSAA